MWASIDKFQLDCGQFVATWFARLTGRSCFDPARFALVLAFAGIVAEWLRYTEIAPKIIFGVLIVLGVGAVIICMMYISYLEGTVIRSGSANPERHLPGSAFNRCLQTCLVMITIARRIFEVGAITPADFFTLGLWAYAYLVACEAPPPWVKKESVENLEPQTT